MEQEQQKKNFIKSDVIGSAIVKVEGSSAKIPKECRIITEITYGKNMKAKILAMSDDAILLEFWHKDHPDNVRIDWIVAEHYR